MSYRRIGKTVCLFCPPGCGIVVEIKNNVTVKVEVTRITQPYLRQG